MSDRDEIIFRQKAFNCFSVEFSYNAEFIEYLKKRVFLSNRQYDSETKIWTVKDSDGKTLNALTGVAAQKFAFATLWFRNDFARGREN